MNNTTITQNSTTLSVQFIPFYEDENIACLMGEWQKILIFRHSSISFLSFHSEKTEPIMI